MNVRGESGGRGEPVANRKLDGLGDLTVVTGATLSRITPD